MRTTPCGGCARSITDAFLCSECTDRLVEALHGVRALTEDLEISLCRMARVGSRIGSRPGGEVPLAFDWSAAEALWLVDQVVCGWAEAVAGGRVEAASWALTDPKDPARIFPARGRIEQAAGWLAAHAQLVRSRQDAGEWVDQLADALAVARRTIDLPPQLAYAGPCWEDVEDPDDPQGLPLQCEGSLYAPPRAAVAVCPECGAEHDMAKRREWLLRMAEDQPVTATLASRALQGLLGREITASMIRGLAHRGALTPVPTPEGTPRDPQGRIPTVYRLGDVVDALVASQNGKKDGAMQAEGVL